LKIAELGKQITDRLDRNEKAQTEHLGKIYSKCEHNNVALAEVKTEIKGLRRDIERQNGSIGDLGGKIGENTEKISTNKTGIATLKENLREEAGKIALIVSVILFILKWALIPG